MSGADDQRAAEIPDARKDPAGRWTEMHDECHIIVDRLRAELAETRRLGDSALDAIAVKIDALAEAAQRESRAEELALELQDDVAALQRSARGDAPTEPPAVELPVTLSSVDDVAAVCLAHGLTTLDEGRAWQTPAVLVMTDHDAVDGRLDSYCVYRSGNDEPMVAIQPHAPSAVLAAAIEAARGGSR